MNLDRDHRFEMASTLAELARLAPFLDPGHPSRCDASGVHGAFGPDAAPWSILFAAPRERVIASMRIPIADVTIRLIGFDDRLAARFLERFHLVFRKGGG